MVTLLIHFYAIDHLRDDVSILFFRFKLVLNAGFIFGLFNDTSHFVRIVCSAVFLGVLSIIWCYFYNFLSAEVQLLKIGMTLVLAGVTGNALEKLIYGYVSDYISLNVGYLSSFYFNLSDVIQIVGLIIIVRELFVNQEIIWFPNATIRRKRLVLDPEVQLPMMMKMMGLFFIGSLTQGILAVALLFPYLKRGSQDVQVLFIMCLFILNVALLPLIGRYLLKELLRFIGPIFALNKHLNDDESINKPLQFRKTDHFKSLETSYNRFISRNIKRD